MFQLDPPGIYELIKENKILDNGAFSRLQKNQVVVISVVGSCKFHDEKGYKKAFRLIIDSFGSPTLFEDETNVQDFQNEVGQSVKLPKLGDDKNSENSPSSNIDDRQIVGSIEGFYSEDEGAIFLHLHGAYDPKAFLTEWKKLSTGKQNKGFNEIWAEIKSNYYRSLLLLFSLSHVVIISSTASYFDTNYIHTFRVLDGVRNEVLPYVSKLLGEVEGMSKSWKDHGRLCSPRILFLFHYESETPIKISKITANRNNPVKKLQYKLEEEIYHILRKCRVVTNISANSLFAIPTTEEYVFIYDQGVQKVETRDSNQKIPFHLVTNFCTKRIETMSDSANAGYKIMTKASSSNSSSIVAKSYCDTLRTYSDVLYDFREFIVAHSRLAHDTGFDDDSKRVAEHKHFFVIPTFKSWIKAFNLLSNYFVRETHADSRAKEALDLINQYNSIDSEYLESQCAVRFPKVYAAYLKNLPEIYPEQLHQAKLTAAVNIFLKVSRGPEVRSWLQKLSDKCDKYWKNGRQQCEARSLKENMCCLAIHRVRLEDHLEVLPLPEMDEKLPLKSHCTGRRYLSYCNCGRSQAAREEPFTIRESNYDFYVRIGYDCCSTLECIQFPVFVPPPDFVPDSQEMLLRIQTRQQMGYDSYFTNQVSSSQDLEDELRQGSSLDVAEYDAVDNFNEEAENYNDILRDEADAKSRKDEVSDGEDSDGGGKSESEKQSHRMETKEIRAKWEAMMKKQSEEEQGGRDRRDAGEGNVKGAVEVVESVFEGDDVSKSRRQNLEIDNVVIDEIESDALKSGGDFVTDGVLEQRKSGDKLFKEPQPVDKKGQRRRGSLSRKSRKEGNELDDKDTGELPVPNTAVSDNNIKQDYDLEVELLMERLNISSSAASGSRDTKSGCALDESGGQSANGNIVTANPARSRPESVSIPGTPTSDICDEETQEQTTKQTTENSMIEFLPGMLHSKSVPGLLPLFSSWSLVCLGSSSLYCHNSGITHQPGFLNGSSTLLPWDKKVKAEAGVSKPIPRLIRGRRPSTRVKKITDEFSVKIFIGVEYECKRGHRFVLESPDKILQTSGQSTTPNLKQVASIVATSDMPLYFPCPCKENRDAAVTIAQLIRVHIVTPKAPVHVTLNPRVQPGPSPCPIFFPGNMEPVRLTPSSYWVLRLPYSYVGEDQVYVPSRDVTIYNGKLLKGLYDVHTMSPSETKIWEAENNT